MILGEDVAKNPEKLPFFLLVLLALSRVNNKGVRSFKKIRIESHVATRSVKIFPRIYSNIMENNLRLYGKKPSLELYKSSQAGTMLQANFYRISLSLARADNDKNSPRSPLIAALHSRHSREFNYRYVASREPSESRLRSIVMVHKDNFWSLYNFKSYQQ